MPTNINKTVLTNVLKSGPDRPVGPVQPSTGHHSGPIRSFGPDWDRTGVEPFEPAVQPVNRTNRPVPKKPTDSKDFNFSLKKNYKIKMLPRIPCNLKRNLLKDVGPVLWHSPHTHSTLCGLSFEPAHKPIFKLKAILSKEPFIGAIWLLVSLTFRCGIAKYQRKKT